MFWQESAAFPDCFHLLSQKETSSLFGREQFIDRCVRCWRYRMQEQSSGRVGAIMDQERADGIPDKIIITQDWLGLDKASTISRGQITMQTYYYRQRRREVKEASGMEGKTQQSEGKQKTKENKLYVWKLFPQKDLQAQKKKKEIKQGVKIIR